MADYSLIIIGGGLSGLAAGIRFARFGGSVLILEKHAIAGGLNSYYFRKGFLLETGLHAMTNFAGPGDKRAPLNRLFRQLKLSRHDFVTHEQYSSLIHFPGGNTLRFSNDFNLLQDEIASRFPAEIAGFNRLLAELNGYEPFTPREWLSTRAMLGRFLSDPLLIDMLLLPLMVYGNSEEHDMDFSQFVIMFRSIYQEGFFRPAGTMKDFLALLVDRFTAHGGEIRFNSQVEEIGMSGEKASHVKLAGGETISCEAIISTAGAPGTFAMLALPRQEERYAGRMSFVESISILPGQAKKEVKAEHTIIFYNLSDRWQYCRPAEAVDTSWGVICFPENFQGMPPSDYFQIRVTHAANYDLWKKASALDYGAMKQHWGARSREITAKIIGNYQQNIVYEDSFTPVTIERYTAKARGAVYGSPVKIKDGRTPCRNVFIAGTDQGFLGIVGSMLSGVTIVNQHLLTSEGV
ncbi:MAG: NAD(P)/FAD-dependent oxidoreductase [Desulfobacteraceae bacterium]|nr:MAG: NAD(P)/FAD-dependent oxidoreductase [Desulfobacteraceae bacterium]